jgi:hypothetical protein
MGSPSTSAVRESDGKFIELDVLRSASGVKGIISQRVASGVITFSITKEFSRNGVLEWTSFFSEVEMDDFDEMVELVKKRIAELRKDPTIAQIRSPGKRS